MKKIAIFVVLLIASLSSHAFAGLLAVEGNIRGSALQYPTFGSILHTLETNDIPHSDATVSFTLGGDFNMDYETLGLMIDGMDLGYFLNNDPTDDLFDNESFNDVGVREWGDGPYAGLTGVSLIPLATLQDMLLDNTLEILIYATTALNDFFDAEEGIDKGTYSVKISYSTPEPSTFLLLGISLLCVIIYARRKSAL